MPCGLIPQSVSAGHIPKMCRKKPCAKDLSKTQIIIPEMLVSLRNQKMLNLRPSNSCNCWENFWKTPNVERDTAQRWCIPKMPSSNQPSGLQSTQECGSRRVAFCNHSVCTGKQNGKNSARYLFNHTHISVLSMSPTSGPQLPATLDHLWRLVPVASSADKWFVNSRSNKRQLTNPWTKFYDRLKCSSGFL